MVKLYKTSCVWIVSVWLVIHVAPPVCNAITATCNVIRGAL